MDATPQDLGARIEKDPRWRAVMARDAAADGSFVFGVRTTGVYCRPSCPSRRANPKNVDFFTSPEMAEKAGLRACLRCAPKGASREARRTDTMARICRMIEAAEEPPKLADLAAAAGMSPFHFLRQFKAVTGLTPSAFARAHRVERVKAALGRPQTSVTAAIYGAGFNSNGRFYEAASDMLGMKPTEYRAGGANAKIRFAIGECSLGPILVAQSERGVCAITMGDDPDTLVRQLQDRFPQAEIIGGDATFEGLVAKVVGLIERPDQDFDLPLDVRGTAFQHRVWQALRQIPAGTTASYADLAELIGAPKSARAVARACAANEIAVAIPCHRVVRTDGALSGYRWGVERKRALLRKEATR
jgi:AraC family transcriptional regulator of adaptative response/methylated-DNA-[protein]-cysteine methyltransferase